MTSESRSGRVALHTRLWSICGSTTTCWVECLHGGVRRLLMLLSFVGSHKVLLISIQLLRCCCCCSGQQRTLSWHQLVNSDHVGPSVQEVPKVVLGGVSVRMHRSPSERSWAVCQKDVQCGCQHVLHTCMHSNLVVHRWSCMWILLTRPAWNSGISIIQLPRPWSEVPNCRSVHASSALPGSRIPFDVNVAIYTDHGTPCAGLPVDREAFMQRLGCKMPAVLYPANNRESPSTARGRGGGGGGGGRKYDGD